MLLMGSRSLRVVDPIDPFEGGELDGLDVSPPWPAPVDHLSLAETVDGFGEGVVVGSSDAANRRLYVCFGQKIEMYWRPCRYGTRARRDGSGVDDAVPAPPRRARSRRAPCDDFRRDAQLD